MFAQGGFPDITYPSLKLTSMVLKLKRRWVVTFRFISSLKLTSMVLKWCVLMKDKDLFYSLKLTSMVLKLLFVKINNNPPTSLKLTSMVLKLKKLFFYLISLFMFQINLYGI